MTDVFSHVEKHVKDDDKCVICLTNEKEIFFNPCKHISICQTCRSKIVTSQRVFIV